ncbi:MAG: methyltransferase domain-containing protein [Bacteroidetes bacterium]|nr:methyltransferase domain-containing protein [Bacteroidota bacterium]
MTAYRQLLYSNYHSTQSGRASGTDRSALFLRERKQFSEEILPLLEYMNREAKILDMGCGSGSLLSAMSHFGFADTLGVDVSPEQVALAGEMGVRGVIQGDVLEVLRSSKNKFDLITGMDIIEHFTKDELVELLQAAYTALRPGGMLLLRTPNMDAPIASVFAYGDFTHELLLNASGAQQVMLAAGFSRVDVLPSLMRTDGWLKEQMRKITWSFLSFRLKLELFATARSSRNVVFTPNLIIKAIKAS